MPYYPSESPRPVCPECERVCRPETAHVVTLAGSKLRQELTPRRVLVGVYCSADCVLDAWRRGYPWCRLVPPQ